MTGNVVRYACDVCCRFWATDAELQAHKCGEPGAIVHELAERGPFAHAGSSVCVHCGLSISGQPEFNDPANHEPSCLWRRARELHPPT